MSLKYLFSCSFFVFFLVLGCGFNKEEINPIQEYVTMVKEEFAPDKRVALFDIEAIKKADKYILKGESNLPSAVHVLKQRLSSKSLAFVDSVEILPSKELEGKTQGIIKISVANLRSKPVHSAELATQATLGTPVKVYKSFENWYLIQTPDNYLSWVDSGGLELMDSLRMAIWKSSKKVIFTKIFGHAYSKPDATSGVVSDIVAGGVLKKMDEAGNFFKVKYPDGRVAFIQKEKAMDYNIWLAKMNPTGETLAATSRMLMGVPYLWGGTSTKGVDCSGFTKTIFFLNGMVIPRDASQQVRTGKEVDSTGNFENLVTGDLLFFGRKATDSTPEKVVHVGMWLGNNEFIHSSGRVQVNSFDKNATHYDAYNYNRYLRTKRVLKVENEGLINLVNTPIFKD